MPDSRKFGFRVTVEHLTTHESFTYIGDGVTVAEAVNDGAKLLKEPFRPSSSGARNVPLPLQVTLPDGRLVARTLEEFESGIPYAGRDDLRDPSHPSLSKPAAPKVPVEDY